MNNLEQAAPVDMSQEAAGSRRLYSTLRRLYGWWKLTSLPEVPCRNYTPFPYRRLKVPSRRTALGFCRAQLGQYWHRWGPNIQVRSLEMQCLWIHLRCFPVRFWVESLWRRVVNVQEEKMSGAHVRDAFSGYDLNRLSLKRICCCTNDSVFCGSLLYVVLDRSCNSFDAPKFLR